MAYVAFITNRNRKESVSTLDARELTRAAIGDIYASLGLSRDSENKTRFGKISDPAVFHGPRKLADHEPTSPTLDG